MSRFRRLVFLGLLLFSLSAWAQAPAGEAKRASEGAAKPQVENPEAKEAKELAKEEESDTDKFKKSPAVKWLAKLLHIPLGAAYYTFYGIDFAIVAGAIIVISRSKLPGMFRSRNEMIRKSMDEAQKSGAEARERLGQIEARLSRLDAEIAEMRSAAEAEAVQEDERIRAAAEQDKKNIIAAAEQEIAAASQVARRDLKSFAAGLAVDLAEKRLKVDADTDRALVRRFAGQFGKDGQ